MGSEPERPSSLLGVGGAARVQGEVWNTGDPLRCPRRDNACRISRRRSRALAQRKSEGVTVLLISTTKNVEGGRGLCFGHARARVRVRAWPTCSVLHTPSTIVDVTKAQEPSDELRLRAKWSTRVSVISTASSGLSHHQCRSKPREVTLARSGQGARRATCMLGQEGHRKAVCGKSASTV